MDVDRGAGSGGISGGSVNFTFPLFSNSSSFFRPCVPPFPLLDTAQSIAGHFRGGPARRLNKLSRARGWPGWKVGRPIVGAGVARKNREGGGGIQNTPAECSILEMEIGKHECATSARGITAASRASGMRPANFSGPVPPPPPSRPFGPVE